MSLTYEPSSEPPHISANQLFSNDLDRQDGVLRDDARDIVQQHLVQIGRTDGPAEYLS